MHKQEKRFEEAKEDLRAGGPGRGTWSASPLEERLRVPVLLRRVPLATPSSSARRPGATIDPATPRGQQAPAGGGLRLGPGLAEAARAGHQERRCSRPQASRGRAAGRRWSSRFLRSSRRGAGLGRYVRLLQDEHARYCHTAAALFYAHNQFGEARKRFEEIVKTTPSTRWPSSRPTSSWRAL